MWVVNNTFQYVSNNIKEAYIFLGVVVSVFMTGLVLALFNVFTLTLVFSYFDDVVYKAIFFFLTIAITLNVLVALVVFITKLLSD